MDELSISEPTQCCIKCHNDYPATPEFFHRHKECTNGLRKICKKCRSEIYQENRPAIQEQNKRVYQKNRSQRLLKQSKYYEVNKVTIREKERLRALAKRDTINARQRVYHRANRDIIAEKKRISRPKRRLEINARKRDIYHANKTKMRMQVAAAHKRRKAKQRNLPDIFTTADWQTALHYWHYACAICGNQEGFTWTLAMDHWIPLISPKCPGTLPSNILPLCHGEGGCNNCKGGKDPTIWLIERLGKHYAAKKMKEITAYFVSLEHLEV